MADTTRHEFDFRAYDSGDYESACFAVPEEDCKKNGWKWDAHDLNRFHKGLVSIYHNRLWPNLDTKQLYRFIITVEITPIDEPEFQPHSGKMIKAIKRQQKVFEPFSRYFVNTTRDEMEE